MVMWDRRSEFVMDNTVLWIGSRGLGEGIIAAGPHYRIRLLFGTFGEAHDFQARGRQGAGCDRGLRVRRDQGKFQQIST